MNYKKIFQHATDAMIFFDSSGKITKINKEMEKLTAYDENTLTGRSLKELLDNYSRVEVEDLKKNPGQRREITVITKDNEKKEIDTKINKFDDNLYFAILRDITKHKKLAERDPLTKIYNYRKFYDKLEEEMKRSERYGHDLSVLLIDVDDFKKYNDTKGHVAGDQLLKEIGELLQEKLRLPDTVARYGGDEFGIILPETKKAQKNLLKG